METIDKVKRMVIDGVLSQEEAEKYFPELAESEDEKIRIGLIEACKQSIIVGGFHKDKVIAWLEKQGEQKPVNDTQEYLKGVDRVQNYEELTKFEKGFDRIADTYAHNKNKEGYNSPWYTKERAAEMLHWAKEELGLIEKQGEHWKPSGEHCELEEFAKIVRGNLTGISEDVQGQFEAKYLQLTGNRMYGGFKD